MFDCFDLQIWVYTTPTLVLGLHVLLTSGNLIARRSMTKQLQVDEKFTWVIKNFDSLESDYLHSDQFVVGGCKWYEDELVF